ncbi:hypothetical protein B7494_g4841 [Chlorociboria aeruginascens]|nr:hypothetical protein B7494_g4841 [Chlorociboria aeruginascens]
MIMTPNICQVATHGDGYITGWRICFVPCSCGKKYYPEKAKPAVPLAPSENKESHPVYRPLTPLEEHKKTAKYGEMAANKSESLPSQGVTWSAGHGRVDSEESEDPLAWSKERYEQGTESFAKLTEGFARTNIREETTVDWSLWSWNKEYGQWVRSREKSPGDWEYDYCALSADWIDWGWSEEWGQWERSAKDPDGNWRYDYEAHIDKGKGAEKETAGSNIYEDPGSGDTSGSVEKEALLVDTVKEKDYYYFRNEDGKRVRIVKSDWKKHSRYANGQWHDCLHYVGKNSGNVYHTWQLGKSKRQP